MEGLAISLPVLGGSDEDESEEDGGDDPDEDADAEAEDEEEDSASIVAVDLFPELGGSDFVAVVDFEASVSTFPSSDSVFFSVVPSPSSSA
jgi:hypothetical protein